MEAINLFVKTNEQLRTGIERLMADGSLRATRVNLDAGEFLFRDGDNINHTFYVEKGLIKLFSDTEDGYSKTVFLHKAGTLLGFQYFQDENERRPSILNATASVKSTIVRIDADDFVDCLKADGDLCFAMSQYLFSMMALQTREAVNSSMFSVLQRFAALLLTLAQEVGGALEPVLIPFGNAELAEMLGVHVNSVTNAISSLRKAGCVDKQRGYLAIIDMDKLATVAEDLVAN